MIRCINISKNYIYTFLKLDKTTNFLISKSVGSGYPAVQQNDLKSMKIPIPCNTVLITNLEKDFKKIETLQQEIKDSEIEYKYVLQELSDDIKLETKTNNKPCKKNNIDQYTETNDQNVLDKSVNSDEPPMKMKIKKVVKKEYNSDNDDQNISDEPCIKKKIKKVVKNKYNSEDERETKHIVSNEPLTKKKTKKIVKKEHNSDDERETKHIVSDEPVIKKKIKKIVKE